ncbi:MAG TPA: cation transporter [Nitriliruptorales bacterium]|nr:cation transporter [Nitriliruptorales bacterium]
MTADSSPASVTIDRLPEDKQRLYHRAVVLQWITLVHVTVAAVLLYLVLSGSQAMKGAWLDDLIGLIPPIAYLVAGRFDWRRPTARFPYGYHRAQSIAFFWAALTLLLLGVYLVGESLLKLLHREHPSIGMAELFGFRLWLGWLMLGALAFTGIPQVFLGRAKVPIAEQLNDKVLHADADMNKADWLAAGAASVGVVGIGLGLWWADAVAATFIGLEITRDGVQHMRGFTWHLLGETPRSVDYADVLPLPERVESTATEAPWVREARARIREEGRVYFGELFVVTDRDQVEVEAVDALSRRLYELDWRIQDLVVTVVPSLDVDSHLKGRQG